MCKKLIILCLALVVVGLSVPASADYVGAGNPLKVDIDGGFIVTPTCTWQSWVFPTPWFGPQVKWFVNPLANNPGQNPIAELDVYDKSLAPPNTGLSRNRSGGWAGVGGMSIMGGGTGFGMNYVKLTIIQLAPSTTYKVSLWSFEARNIWSAAPGNPDSKFVCWSTTNPKQWLDDHGYGEGGPNAVRPGGGYGPIIPLPNPLTGESGMPGKDTGGLYDLVLGEGAQGGRAFVMASGPGNFLGGADYCVSFYAMTNDDGVIVIYGWIDPTDWIGSMHVPLNGFEVPGSELPPCIVPNVVGGAQDAASQDAACTAIENAGFVCCTTTTCSDTIAAGNVISMTPPGGAEIECGGGVDIVVSTGPCSCTVPDVVDQTQGAACTAIGSAGLVCGNITTACSDTIAAGNVISTTPAGWASVACGSAVDIVVSTGPCPCTVPDVVGQTQDAACTAIENANLVCGNITTACSATIAAGNVISTTPAGGASVTCGSAVDIVVSTGLCHDIKWSQPPEIHEGIINGWDETSDYNSPPLPVVADDWLCVDARPIKGIHWWGSFKGWTEPNRVPPAQMPEAFHIGIWTDVPDPDLNDPNTFSHPGQLIWEKTSHCFAWSFAGNDSDACFKFDQLLSENEWFHQDANEPNGTIYWLSIAAIYDGDTPQYPWGWKTRPHYYKDDAVRIQTLVGNQWPPVVGSLWGSGVPIRLPEYPDPCGVSWDTAFVLTADRQYVPLKWRWTDDADRADLVEDGKIDFKDFAILAQHWLDEAGPWPE